MITETTSPPSGLASPSCCLSSFLDRVIHGDNCETLAAMPAESVDLVVTSPPYDDLRTYGGHSWDFPLLACELARVLKPGGVIVWVVNDQTKDFCETGTSMRQALHFMDVCGLNLLDTMVYLKNGGPSPYPGLMRYPGWTEFMFVISKGKPKTFNAIRDRKNTRSKLEKSTARQRDGTTKDAGRYTGKEFGTRPNYWIYDPQSDRQTNHPAAFPLALAKDHVASWSNPGDLVLDPFAGGGTTLKAAKELGRRFVGIEINPQYVEICRNRLDQEVLNLFPDNNQIITPGKE
jgi:DNA modification methylase